MCIRDRKNSKKIFEGYRKHQKLWNGIFIVLFAVIGIGLAIANGTVEWNPQLVIGRYEFTLFHAIMLVVMVVLLPILVVNDLGMGDPFFCKYLCPQGVLEGAIPLSLASESVRSALGSLFTWKSVVLGAVVVLSLLFYRPFCKWLCPLGAFYALFNRVSLTGMQVDAHKCVHCGRCAKACKMDVDVTKTPNHTECIRCGMCVKACPTGAVSFRCGLSRGAKEKENPAGKQAVEK